MCVGGVESGVCGFYTTLHTEYCYSCQRCRRLYSVYISMGTKLHPPYPNQDCLPVFWSEKCLQCLKNVGLYNSFGIGRFSLWQSWLTRASRLANSQASASKAGVPGDPNLPESNCSYLSLIWSVKELYSLCASCTVNNETGFGMTDQVISM